MRFSYANGRHQLISVGGTSTNDRGEYRAFGLRAGRYLLRASVPGAPMSRPIESGALIPEAQDPYAAVYYPGVLEVDAASPISLAEGGELADVDFQLRKVRATTVRGHLVSPADKFSASQIQVVLAHNEGNVASYIDRASAFVDSATGKFEIRGVSPGSYLLVASQVSAGAGRACAYGSKRHGGAGRRDCGAHTCLRYYRHCRGRGRTARKSPEPHGPAGAGRGPGTRSCTFE